MAHSWSSPLQLRIVALMHKMMGWLVCHGAAVDEAGRQPSTASFPILNAAPINVALVDHVSNEHMAVVSKPQNAVRVLEQLNRIPCGWNESRTLSVICGASNSRWCATTKHDDFPAIVPQAS